MNWIKISKYIYKYIDSINRNSFGTKNKDEEEGVAATITREKICGLKCEKGLDIRKP